MPLAWLPWHCSPARQPSCTSGSRPVRWGEQNWWCSSSTPCWSGPQLAALVDGESSRSASWLAGRSILTSFVQRLPWGVSHVQQYLPLLPLAIEQLDLSGYPLVLSSSHLVAKGVLTSPDQCHVSYVHTPVRYAWDQMHAYLAPARPWRGVASGPLDPMAAASPAPVGRAQRSAARCVDRQFPLHRRAASAATGAGAPPWCIRRWPWSGSAGINPATTCISACAGWCPTSGWIWWCRPSTPPVCRWW